MIDVTSPASIGKRGCYVRFMQGWKPQSEDQADAHARKLIAMSGLERLSVAAHPTTLDAISDTLVAAATSEYTTRSGINQSACRRPKELIEAA